MPLTRTKHVLDADKPKVLVSVTGEVDLFTAPGLEVDLANALDDFDGDVIIDLSGVEFIDSTGLRVLIGIHNRLRDTPRAAVLVVATKPVARVLTITGLDRVFSISRSLDEARHHLATAA